MKNLMNKMSRCFIGILCLSIGYTGMGQENKINTQLSQVFKKTDKDQYIKQLLTHQDTTIVILERNRVFKAPSEYIIETYDANFNKISSYHYEVSGKQIQTAIIHKEQLILFEISADKKTKQVRYTASYSPLHTFNFSEKELANISIQRNPEDLLHWGTIWDPNGIEQGFFGDLSFFSKLTIAEDRSSFVISFDHADAKNKTKTYHIVAFDFEFSKTFEHQFTIDMYEDKYFIYKDFHLAVDGTFYFVARTPKKIKDPHGIRYLVKTKKEQITYELFKITKEKINSIQIPSNPYFLNSMQFVKTEDQIICVGFYGDKKYGVDEGSFFMKFDADNLNALTTKYHPFNTQFFQDKYGTSSGKKSIENTWIRSVFSTPSQKDIVLNAEEFNLKDMTMGGMSATRSEHEDIMSFRYTREGEIMYQRVINKFQGTKYGSHSYGSFMRGEYTYFLFNSHPRRPDKDKLEYRLQQSNYNDRNLYALAIDKEGKELHFMVYDYPDRINFAITDVVQKSSSELLLRGEDDKKYKFLKVTLDQNK